MCEHILKLKRWQKVTATRTFLSFREGFENISLVYATGIHKLKDLEPNAWLIPFSSSSGS